MNKNNVLLYIFFVSFHFVNGMSRTQLKKTLTIMKNQCMPKHGVTNEKVGKIEQGVFMEDHNVMCYIACVYKTVQVLRNDRLDKDLIMKQIDILYPPEIREESKRSVIECLPIQYNYEDTCEGIFNAVKCLYKENPSTFIFP